MGSRPTPSPLPTLTIFTSKICHSSCIFCKEITSQSYETYSALFNQNEYWSGCFCGLHIFHFDFFEVKPNRFTNFTNLFCHETLHVSDSSSVYHQEFIHCTLSNGICHTYLDTAKLSTNLYDMLSTNLYDINYY